MMTPQRDKMMRPGQKAAEVVVLCTSDCVMPGEGEFKHGEQIVCDSERAKRLLQNPNFKKEA